MQNIVNNFLRDEGAEHDGAGFEPGPHEGGTSLCSPSPAPQKWSRIWVILSKASEQASSGSRLSPKKLEIYNRQFKSKERGAEMTNL